ncbi:MAG: hypothetical protein SH821_17810 [Phototrophicales bacterium]|nr:hypothetical protein [Phototrophicales bacterium]
MSAQIYILDTNVISDIIKKHSSIIEQIRIKQSTNILCLTQPVEFEILRGLFRKKAMRQLLYYQTQIRPKFQCLALTDADWQLATHGTTILNSNDFQISMDKHFQVNYQLKAPLSPPAPLSPLRGERGRNPF